MKLLLLVFLVVSAPVFAVEVTVKWTFTHVHDGFDHDNRIIVTVDGNQSGTSEVMKQTATGAFTFSAEPGGHFVTISAWVEYNGEWELHSIENNYESDAFYEGELEVTKAVTLELVFDLVTGATKSTLSPSRKLRKKKAQTVGLVINWRFEGVVDGFDHLNSMHVFVDGKRVAVTPQINLTVPGTVTLAVARGRHAILVENYVLYEGEWQPQRKETDFAVDAVYSDKLWFRKHRAISLVFSIPEGTTTVISD